MSSPRILREGEAQALLDLLDGWPFSDGGTESHWSGPGGGREFFRRFVELDPSFSPENVWVIEESGRLVSCVQIFPRVLRACSITSPGTTALACGGIGSVFTVPDRRGRGHGGKLLAAATEGMVERGMEVSLLVAARVAWYEKHGWAPWSALETRLTPPGEHPEETSGDPSEVRAFEDADLEEVRRIGELYSASRWGSVRRSVGDWRASLGLAGNPREDFWLALRDREAVAYLRATGLYGERRILEWGYAPGSIDEQVLLFRSGLAASSSAVTLPLRDAALEAALIRAGWRLSHETGSSWMLRALDPSGLARRFGVPASEATSRLLDRLLPRERFAFWLADRF